jgi:GT2 family glycosyltransferase
MSVALGRSVRPGLSVIVCTSARVESLARCVQSILANTSPAFELIVADQSPNDASERMLAEFADPRLRVLRLRSTGKARALNVAAALAQGAVLALTDDDCTVPKDWLHRVATRLEEDQPAGIVFGAVVAAAHDAREWFVPTFRPRYRRLQGPLASTPHIGMGANMAIRRSVLERVGGFNECLGPGGRFRSGDDWELAYRALAAGFVVVQDPATVVVHWGRRAYGSGAVRLSISNNYLGAGAGYTMHARIGSWVPAYLLVKEGVLTGIGIGRNLLCLRRPFGARRLIALVRGVAEALHCSSAELRACIPRVVGSD